MANQYLSLSSFFKFYNNISFFLNLSLEYKNPSLDNNLKEVGHSFLQTSNWCEAHLNSLQPIELGIIIDF